MKSRIVFLCTLATFLSPMSVMAAGEMVKTDIPPTMSKCGDWAKKVLDERAAPIAQVRHASGPVQTVAGGN